MSFLVAACRMLSGGSARPPGRLRSSLAARSAPVRWRPVPAGWVATALLLAMAAAGCAARAGVALPSQPRPQAVRPEPLSHPKLTPRQQVIAAYTGYWRAFAEAMSAQSAARATAILTPYESPSDVALIVKADRKVWAAHEIAYGGAVTHILSVARTGNRASLHDCLDLSHFGAEDARTGRVVPDSFGLPHLNTYVTVVRSQGRWLVSNMEPVEVPCGS